MNPSPPRRWWRSPALHFIAIGLFLFLVHARVARPAGDRLVVSAGFVEGLRREHQQRTGKLPTSEEERGLVDRFIDEEVLYREALSLGLDRGDTIVRRRLVQKMEFLLHDAARASEPSDAELESYLAAHSDRYRRPGTLGFHQVFLSRDRRGDSITADAAQALSALRAGADFEHLGDPFLQGNTWSKRTEREIAATFGPDFATALAALPAGAWSGPLKSSYGEHLVYVDEHQDDRPPALAAVRDRVREDWLGERREEDDRASTRRLRDHYRIEIEAAPADPPLREASR